MQRFFLSPEQFSGDTATIEGADHLHLARVLRAKPGERVILLDNRGNAFYATLVTIEKAVTTARIEGRAEVAPEPAVKITVAQALGKGDKFEQVIQHGTEAGASAFVPIRAERCVADVPAAKVADRVARWRQIAKGAAEQSGRLSIPTVSEPITFQEWLRNEQTQGTLACLLHPASEAVALKSLLESLPERPRALCFAVGPEGGWSPREVSAATAANITPVALGAHILRTETAALIAVSQIRYALE